MFALTNKEQEAIRLHNQAALLAGMNDYYWTEQYVACDPTLRRYFAVLFELIRNPLQNEVDKNQKDLKIKDNRIKDIQQELDEAYKKLDVACAKEDDLNLQVNFLKDKLKTWEDGCKPLHDYMMQNYTFETWGRSIPTKALEVLKNTKSKLSKAMEVVEGLEKFCDKTFEARMAAINADDKISELGRKAHDIINAELPSSPLKKGDKILSMNCKPGGRELLGDIPNEEKRICTVIEVLSDRFCTDLFVTPRHFEDKNKTWWDCETTLNVGDEIWTVPLCSLRREEVRKTKIRKIVGGEFWLDWPSGFNMARKISDLGTTWWYEKPSL
jgi:hypothetical protein